MAQQELRGIAKNVSVMAAQQVITTASSILLTMVLPRYLGPVEYGKLYLAVSVVMIFQVLVNYGSSYLIAKTVSRAPEQTAQVVADSGILRFILSVIAYAALYVLTRLSGYPEDVERTILVYGLILFTYAGTSTLYAAYQGRESMVYTSRGAVVEKVFVSAVAIVAVLMGAGVATVAAIIVFGTLLNLAVMTSTLDRIATRMARVNWKNIRLQLREGVPYFLFGIFSSIYYRIDSLMLSKMAPADTVGHYGAAYRLFESLNIPYILSTALYPVLSRLWMEETQTHRRTTQKMLEFVLVLGVPISAGIIVFSREIISLFYGLQAYSASIIVLQVLAAGMLILYVDMILGTTLIASDRQRQLTIRSFAAIPVNVGLNLVLIPFFLTRFGNAGIGSAIATGVTELFLMVLYIFLMPKGVLSGFRFSVLFKSLGATAIMLAAIAGMSALAFPWALQIGIAALVYAGSAGVFEILEPEEYRYLRSLVRSRFEKLRNRMQRKRKMVPEGASAPYITVATKPKKVLFLSLPFSGIEVFFRNLQASISETKKIEPVWVFLDVKADGFLTNLPPISSNWVLKGGVGAASRIAKLERDGHHFDAAVINSIVPALVLRPFMYRVPTVFWLDATPALMRELGWYHTAPRRSDRLDQQVKNRLVSSATYRAARHLLAWSTPVKRSLIDHYRVPEEQITVLPLGINTDFWSPAPAAARSGKDGDGVKILFVGGNFNRKGGDLLLALANEEEFRHCEFHFATWDDVSSSSPNVWVHRRLTPNSSELMTLYRNADIFCLPTRADFAPTNALCEAMAMTVPVITTNVGGLDEVVIDGKTGFVVVPDDLQMLRDRLRKLVASSQLRRSMGKEGRVWVQERFSMQRNADTMMDIVCSLLPGPADEEPESARPARRMTPIREFR